MNDADFLKKWYWSTRLIHDHIFECECGATDTQLIDLGLDFPDYLSVSIGCLECGKETRGTIHKPDVDILPEMRVADSNATLRIPRFHPFEEWSDGKPLKS
jgi:hypothetical protein